MVKMSLSKEALRDSEPFIVEKDEKNSSANRLVLRANLHTEDDVKEWLKQYQDESKTNWIVKENFKNLQRVVFHKYWHCQLSALNKLKDGSTRNKKCPVQLDILIKKVNRDTIKNDKNFLGRQTPLPAVITIKGVHSHPTNDECYESTGFLRITSETKQKFFDYFANDMGPAEALRMHETKLLLEENGGKRLADASENPSSRTVYYLYDQWRIDGNGKDWNSDPLAKLKTRMGEFQSLGADIHIDDEDPDNWAVIVVTPIMKRAQKLEAAGEIIFLDSTSSVESTQSTLTLMLCATQGGAVPIAEFIHSGQSMANYTKAFNLLKNNYSNCFGGKKQPEVFMTDHSDAEKGALTNVWPDAQQHLCNFHIGQSEWRWLLKAEHKVPSDRRQYLMSILQKIMHAIDTEEFESALDELRSCGQENYIEHVEAELLPIKEQWVAMFRCEVLNRGNKTNNYSEASIRVLKDIILNRMKRFNVVALTDSIVTVWEPYFVTKLLHYAYNRVGKTTLVYNKLCTSMPPEAAQNIKKDDDGVFWVPSADKKTPDLFYEVQSSIGWCSCPVGRHGAFCKHQALVHKQFGGLFPNKPAIDASSRHQLAQLALGEKCPPPSFFLGIDEIQAGQVVPESVSLNTDHIESSSVEEISGTNEVQDSPQPPEENAEADMSDFLQEMQRLLELGAKCDSQEVFKTSIRRLTCRLKNVRNPNQALTTFLGLSTRAGTLTRRCGRINVQPTSTSRRRSGVSRGSRRIPSGRPPKQPAGTKVKAPKRPHKLALSIMQNRCHPQSHGH